MEFKWGIEHEALETQKHLLISDFVLQYPYFSKEFVLTTDACKDALSQYYQKKMSTQADQ